MEGNFFYKLGVLDIKKLEEKGDYLVRPQIVGLYDYYSESKAPARWLKYFKELKYSDFPLDLHDVDDDVLFREPQHGRLHLPLNYAMSTDAIKSATNDGLELTPVYTSRRALTQIMESYITRYNFSIDISHYNGSLFIAKEKFETQNIIQKHHQRFLKLLFSDSPEKSPQKNTSINRNIGLCALHRTTLGKYDLLYAGDVQGVLAKEQFNQFDDLKAINQLRFVFAKQMHPAKWKDWKLLTYWTQAYLANVDDIYVAFKNEDGIVEMPLKHVKASNIPKIVSTWKPQVCVGVLHKFLKKVEQLMENVNSVDTVYTFYFNAKDRIFYYKKHEGKTEKSFIPQDYANFVAKSMDIQ